MLQHIPFVVLFIAYSSAAISFNHGISNNQGLFGVNFANFKHAEEAQPLSFVNFKHDDGAQHLNFGNFKHDDGAQHLSIISENVANNGIEEAGHHQNQKHVDYYTEPHYQYHYAVHDDKNHDYHHQKEERYGDKVKGEYSLHEADGTIRIVKYEADKLNGFNAVVERRGHAVHPQHYKTYQHHHHH